jgi:predicted MFS family arabinose efflux permease
VIAIVLAWRVIAADHGAQARERFDVVGAMLFTTGLVALLIALNQGHSWGWTSTPLLVLLAVAAALLAAFVRVERHRPSPMLDLSLFRDRQFSGATVSALLNYACVFMVLFVLPFLLIQGRGLDAAHAGLILTAQPIVMAVVAPISGTLSDRIGSRAPAVTGMVVLAAGLAFLASVVSRGSLAVIAAGLAVIGLGVGTFVSPNNNALMGAAPRHRQGIAAGVLATARNVGMVLGVGLAGAVFTTVVARSASGSDALVAGVRASLFTAVGVAVLGTIAAALTRRQGA